MLLAGGLLLSAHIDAISEPEYSDEGISASTLAGHCSMRLGSFVNLADFPVGLSVSDSF
jgi:hypothetical protein